MTVKHKRPALGLAALIAGVAAASTVLSVTGNHATGATTDGCLFGGVYYSCAGGVWNIIPGQIDYRARLAGQPARVTMNLVREFFRQMDARNPQAIVKRRPT
jgi:hypothetical protein